MINQPLHVAYTGIDPSGSCCSASKTTLTPSGGLPLTKSSDGLHRAPSTRPGSMAWNTAASARRRAPLHRGRRLAPRPSRSGMGGALVEPRENTAGWVGGVKRIMGCFYVFLVICLLQRMGGFVIVCVFVSVGKIKGLVGGLCKPVDLDVAGCWVVFAVVPLYPTWKKNTLVFEQSCLTSTLSVPAHTQTVVSQDQIVCSLQKTKVFHSCHARFRVPLPRLKHTLCGHARGNPADAFD